MAAVDDAAAQDVVSRLKFLASVRPGERIDVATLTVLGNTVAARAHRALFARGESRDATLEFVRRTFDDAFAIASACGAHPGAYERRVGGLVAAALDAARGGVAALAETYADDRMYAARVAALIEIVDARIGNDAPMA
jgi:hypothetical protein